jgi:hypothetical protein
VRELGRCSDRGGQAHDQGGERGVRDRCTGSTGVVQGHNTLVLGSQAGAEGGGQAGAGPSDADKRLGHMASCTGAEQPRAAS